MASTLEISTVKAAISSWLRYALLAFTDDVNCPIWTGSHVCRKYGTDAQHLTSASRGCVIDCMSP